MAQGTVDPPNQTASGSSSTVASQANVDELLAQLAGEEIDRLLAEAEAGIEPEAAPPAPLDPIIPYPSASVPTPLPAEKTLPSPATSAATPNLIPPHSTLPHLTSRPGATDSAMSAQLDDLFNQLETQQIAVPSAVASTVATFQAPEFPPEPLATATNEVILEVTLKEGAISPSPPAVEIEVEEDHAAEERSALKLDSHYEPPPEAAEEPRESLLIRFLEFLNSPLDACSEGMREAIGKLALITLFNAAAVLIYVFVIRKHH